LAKTTQESKVELKMKSKTEKKPTCLYHYKTKGHKVLKRVINFLVLSCYGSFITPQVLLNLFKKCFIHNLLYKIAIFPT